MSKKARTRFNRKDRRKAKQSDWQRPGKSNPKKKGHGGSGMVTKAQNRIRTKK